MPWEQAPTTTPAPPGEPPGYWQGAGAAALGLAGQVDADVMRALYHEDIGPDGQVLGRRQRQANYPAASGSLYERVEAEVARQVAERGRFITPEEVRAIRLRLRAQFRTVVPFYDYTFSAPKSVSVLWASLLAASAEAEAEQREADAERFAEQAAQVRGAVKRANDRMIAVAERGLAYVRTGHHSKTTGEWRDAEGFIVASFQQHDAPRRRPAAPRAQRDRQPGAASGRSGREVAGAPWPPAVQEQAAARDARRPVPGPGDGADSAGAACSARTARRSRSAGSARRPPTSSATRARNCGTAPGSSPRSTSAITATLRASRPCGRSSSGPLWRRGTPRITTRRRPGSSSPRGRAKRSGAGRRAVRASLTSSRRVRGGARAERAAERSGAGPDHPQGRRRGPAAERHVGPVAADLRARPGPPLAAR